MLVRAADRADRFSALMLYESDDVVQQCGQLGRSRQEGRM
jgi:hypothetical protein